MWCKWALLKSIIKKCFAFFLFNYITRTLVIVYVALLLKSKQKYDGHYVMQYRQEHEHNVSQYQSSLGTIQ